MILTGKSVDGADAIHGGVYGNPENTEWSNMPYTKEQREHKKLVKIHWKVFDHISGKRSLLDEYDLIKLKKSTLTKICRSYVIDKIEGIIEL